ncbi:hypothetical protein [Paenibacillus apiarius]|uniref:hypothetical protein n=1 Tax=Paenibacillus apiarius TaxID=46240 RepID=UPI001981A032|nr:hypothetical protein [Paenibacillus apiarius]MBN3527690.1 hypothetical protein [Paenibacillus apiarius]
MNDTGIDTNVNVFCMSLDPEQASALHQFICLCFEKAHDMQSDFVLTASQYRLLGSLFNRMEEANLPNAAL